ncbi:MAG: hypothetical protein J6W35_03875 [Eubacterium sp.]|nr:hypothetical protein [Eubacterium sp.]
MKKNIFKKLIVSVLSLSLMFSFSAPVAAASHAANGSNIMPANGKWVSDCVRDDLNYDPSGKGPCTEWEIALLKEMDTNLKKELGSYYTNIKTWNPYTLEQNYATAMSNLTDAHNAGKVSDAEYERLQTVTGWDGIMGWQSFTQGRMIDPNTSKEATMYVANTGWDGEYAAQTYGGEKKLVADNPWGLTITMDKIPVEYTRYYTMEFDIASDLQGKDNETGLQERSDKYCIVKAFDYQSRGEPSAAFESFQVNGKEAAKDGKFKIAKTPKGENLVKTHIKATFKIPDSKNEWSGGHDAGMFTKMGIKFALGAFSKSHEDEVEKGEAPQWEEVANKGYIYVTDLKVIAGTQYAVRYYDGSVQKDLRYVNEYDQAKNIALKKKGYTQTGYINMATGSKFSFGTLIEQDTNLKATWTKTQKPKKASFTAKSKKKKKITVKFKKNANARGYQVKYSHNKKFKKKSKYKTKTKNTSKTSTYTIKGLKSSKIAYVKARAYNLDSCGNKIYGKWSKRKSVYVK